jgi:anti-sigma factor RsiW
MSTPRWFPQRRRAAASPPGGVRCVEMVELMTDYLEGVLPPADRARFEAHIAGCEHCTAYLKQMRMTLRMVRRIEPEALDPAMERGLLDAFKHWKAGGA